MRNINRRKFLKQTTAVSTGIMVSLPIIKNSFAKNSPNDTINISKTS